MLNVPVPPTSHLSLFFCRLAINVPPFFLPPPSCLPPANSHPSASSSLTMPTCRRKRVVLTEPSEALLSSLATDPARLVFYLPKTGEIFETYE